MAATTVDRMPSSFKWRQDGVLTFHNVMLAICTIVLSMRLYTIFIGGGWEDRAQFFGEGDLRPNIVDFVYNEILVNYLIIRVIVFRYNPYVYLLIIVSSFAYFTRLPLILLFFAIVFAREIGFKRKLLLGNIALIISFAILYIRLGEDLIYGDTAAIFYLTYPFIGIGRLIGTTQEYGVSYMQYISLFIKPLDAVLFIVDYIGQYSGELSSGRHVGIELSQFVYIQQLEGAYNAFGTILYPFILIAGWLVGPILFGLFVIFQHLQYRFATQDVGLSKRYIGLLLTTGILFSWTSPFVWLVPFLFTKFRHRGHG